MNTKYFEFFFRIIFSFLYAIFIFVPLQSITAAPDIIRQDVLTSATTIVYDAIPNPLPGNMASQPFQAQQTFEFGDYIHLTGMNRQLSIITVTMSDWALYSDYSSDARYSGNSVTWSHPITVNVYSNHLGVNGAPDTLLATKTQMSTIPWRPIADPTCPTPTAWRFDATHCYNGFAFNLTFDMSSLNITLPNDIIVGFAYNTQSYGVAPIGVNGPYNSLNIGVVGSATVGTDNNIDGVFWNTSTATWYTDGGTAGVRIFREDTGWSPYGTLPIQITAYKSDQTITFDTLADQVLDASDFTVSATSDSGLTVSFSSNTTSVCTVSGTTVHLVATGTCTIRATQEGNSDYNPATPVDQSFTVNASANVAPVITEGSSINVTMSASTPFNLTLNASDTDSDTITWSINTAADHGTALASGTGTSKAIAYTPTSNYIGSDSFVVQISDSNGGIDTITVNVNITAVGPTSFKLFLPLVLR
jgi:hypothetical protein